MKKFHVANPGSDSDDASNHPYSQRRPQGRRVPPQPARAQLSDRNGRTQHSPSPDSPAVDSFSPAHAPSSSLDLPSRLDSSSKPLPTPAYQDRTPTEPIPSVHASRKGRIIQTLKAPFGGRPLNSPRRPRDSPTTTSSPSVSVASTVPERVIFVTADSERYVTVDISGAGTAAQIRELILTKLNIFSEDESHPYSIYQTEIGSYAIGAALSNDHLLALCRAHGDSRGSLKFFVSVASAPVHEPSSPIQSLEHIPPVLPSTSIIPLRVKRRSRSRNGSFSSQSENPPLEVGYEADLDYPDRDSSKATPRAQPQHPASVVSPTNQANAPQPPRRRPSVVHHPRSASPPNQSPEQVIAPATDRLYSQRKEPQYGHALPPLPGAPPPLSPNRPSFSLHDDPVPSFAVPHNRLHHTRSGSDAAAERESAIKAADHQMETRQFRIRDVSSAGKLRAEPSRDNMKGAQPRRPYDEDDSAWEPVPSNISSREDHERVSPSITRSRGPTSKVYRPTYNPSRPPPVPTTLQQEVRPSSQPRPGQKPLPPNFVVTWKGEEGGSRKASPAMTPSWQPNRLGKTFTKSMDNLKLSSPTSATRRNAAPQLPVSRPSGGYPSNLTLSGTPKSYEPPRGSFTRPLPAQASPYPTSAEFSQASASYSSRNQSYPSNLMSPNHDPYPRPQSATGDSMTSPTRGYLHSPIYGSTLDSGDAARSPRTVSPSRAYHSPGAIPGPRPRPNNYSDRSDRSSDIQSGPETSNTTPPRTPVSPHSPRYDASEKNGFMVEPSSPALQDNPMIKDNRNSEMTLKQEDQATYAKLLGSGSAEATLLARSQQHMMASRQISPPPPITIKGSSDSYGADDDDDDDSDNGGGTWIVRPGPPKSPRPPLTVQIDNPPSSSPRYPEGLSQFRPDVPPKDGPPGSYRSGSSTARQAQKRPESTFVDVDNDSWAPRPPPENIYDHLEKFFPKHDLDKPVIEASSGDTSPTSSETAPVLPPPVAPVNEERARIRAKKSIRIVAQEHKKRIDRTSRADTTYTNNNLRKRNTKLWGSRLEEVTTAQARNASNSNLPDSPSGGPTTFKWVRGELIGKGTYGRVYLALNATTGEMIAVKQVELPQTASDKNDSRQHMVVQALKMESETLRDLDHPNIVQYLGFEETPSNLSIFLEYVPGGSVGSCLHKHGKFEDNVVRSFTAQILGGLEYLHSKGILHRDLKADNILVEMSGVCKISDFGISKRTEDVHGGAFTAMQGTVFWMAPEVINTQKSGYNFKIDIWSVGCVVLEMWAGMRPWMGEEMLAVMFKLYQSKQPPPVPEDVVLSEDADDFRRKCFAINPDERPTAAELRKHPYLILPPNWVFTAFT